MPFYAREAAGSGKGVPFALVGIGHIGGGGGARGCCGDRCEAGGGVAWGGKGGYVAESSTVNLGGTFGCGGCWEAEECCCAGCWRLMIGGVGDAGERRLR